MKYQSTAVNLAPNSQAIEPIKQNNGLGIYAVASALIGLFVFVGSGAVAVAGAYLFGVLGEMGPGLLSMCGAAGAVAMAYNGIHWISRFINGDQLETTIQLNNDAPGGELPEMSHMSRLELSARRILELHYLAGQQATRPECEAVGVGQSDWNTINTIMKRIGVKAERSWLAPSYNDALAAWLSQVRIDPDHSIWVRTSATASTWSKVTV